MGTITIKDGTEILRPSPSGRAVLGRSRVGWDGLLSSGIEAMSL